MFHKHSNFKTSRRCYFENPHYYLFTEDDLTQSEESDWTRNFHINLSNCTAGEVAAKDRRSGTLIFHTHKVKNLVYSSDRTLVRKKQSGKRGRVEKSLCKFPSLIHMLYSRYMGSFKVKPIAHLVPKSKSKTAGSKQRRQAHKTFQTTKQCASFEALLGIIFLQSATCHD